MNKMSSTQTFSLLTNLTMMLLQRRHLFTINLIKIKLKKVDAQFKVIKKRLLRIIFKTTGSKAIRN